MRMGVVADDITGANDIGIMFAKSGYLVHVYTYDAPSPLSLALRGGGGGAGGGAPDVIILNTNSRLDPPEVAYRKVYAATRTLADAGCQQFHNKTCSVFRGNIGAEFDAMLDALELAFAVVVLGFPKNGRQTIDGIHYVHGVRLEESEFRHDPVHPMTRSDLVGILGSQTRRTVGLIDHRVVSQGADAVRVALAEARTKVNYVILDVVDQASLAIIAAASHDQPVLCGSSALAEELPAHWGPRTEPLPGLDLPPTGRLGILCAAGSLMPQTQRQIACAVASGVCGLELCTEPLFDAISRGREIGRLAEEAVTRLQMGRDVLVHTPGDAAAVARTHVLGAAHSLSNTETSRLVSASLAEIVGIAVKQCGLHRLAIAGGETSAAVCARLGVTGMRIWREIQPGLPSCVSLAAPPLLLVLKSGSFGTGEFLLEAIEHLKEQ